MRNRIAAAVVAVLLTGVCAGGQALRPLEAPRTGPIGSTVPIREQISTLIGADSPQWAVVIRALDGTVIFERNAEMPLQPASNMKVLTTAAALDSLGPGWTTRTSVYATSHVSDDGTVEGDLVFYGRGDPNLSGRFSAGGDDLEPLRRLAAAVRARGIARVTGDLIADDSYLSGPPHGSGWAWQDLQWHFGTEVSALSYNDNLASIKVIPGVAGSPCQVEIKPDVGYVEILNTTTTGGTARISVHRGVDGSVIEVTGSLPVGDEGVTVDIAVHDPPAYAAAAFRRALAGEGIVVDGTIRRLAAYDQRPESLELHRLHEIASIESRPLAELVRVTNKMSQNLHAELILRILGREHGPSDLPSDQAGAAVVRSFLAKIGARVESTVLADGSGLSRLDRVSASVLDAVIRKMALHESRAAFFESLPVAGVDGTLRHRLGGMQLSAKTGSLATAKSMSGYLTGESGRRYALTLIYNDKDGSTRSAIPIMNHIVEALSKE
ncbi:MAG: D-alanyl-D-alanine carboxypeptidase/D-alanyl-D-alanine-endopeptidase [Blastocatellia bacterium]|nr:D-alanyl-D-alanine carboxypeptidase/D-alanyl-D-alanine-endopeptidase [Blastocatellia bacterium]